MTGRRHQYLDLYVRIGVGILLTCALLVRVGVASPLRITLNDDSFKSDHFRLKPRLLDPRAFDWSIHRKVFCPLDFPEPVTLISCSPIKVQIFRPLGPDFNRPPPQS